MPRPPGHGSAFEPRRREIIDTAAELFARRGYAATGITEICEAVGLARGALYYYIGSKEQLLVEIQSTVLMPLLASARELVALDVAPVVRLRLVSELLLNMHNHTYQWIHPGSSRWDAATLSAEYCATLFRGFAAPGYDPATLEERT